MSIGGIIGCFAALALAVGIVYGAISLVKYEKAHPNPMFITVEGVKYQDMQMSETIIVEGRRYFKLEEQK